MFAKRQSPFTAKVAPKQRVPDYLARDKLVWLLVMQVLVILPLLFYLPIWLWLVWAIAGFWRTQVFRGRWGAPGGVIKTSLALICAAGLFASFSGKAGTETMVGLLVCAFALKLLEVNSARDAQLLVFIGFIITASQLLFSQTPQAALYCMGCLMVLITCWRSLYLTRPEPTKRRFLQGAKVLLHALPIMLVMFIVIPRLGPLWAIPNQNAAKTGFSDSLSPGDLGNLAQDRSPAFRVEFEGNPPAANQLYWRGLVLDTFDGRTWRMRDSWGSFPPRRADTQNIKRNPISYKVIMEPHGQVWLFSLMTPQRATNTADSIRITSDYLLMHHMPVAQRMGYSVTSALQVEWPEAPRLNSSEREFYTRIPHEFNPQTQAIAHAWREQNIGDDQIIAMALALFNREFTYTLQPPTLGEHSVDEFLLTTKRGFCEHFSSSFAFLLRAAGIPARVVVGYQGGRWNPLENYLLVSQSDAHAWTEVWIEGKGWQMIDPTAAVAPNRIEQGINEALGLEDQELVANAWQSSSLLYNLQMRWDAATYVWQRWVLNYDTETQEGLLSRLLGGKEPWRLALWLIGLGLLGATIFAWSLMRNQQQVELRPETKAIRQLERKLLQLGYQRNPGETFGDFVKRVVHSEPQLKNGLISIAQLFEKVAYQNRTEELMQLEQAIKQFP